MKMIKAIWKGIEEERERIKGEGYTADLHFVPDQEILLPEKALEKLKDQILTKKLVVIDNNNNNNENIYLNVNDNSEYLGVKGSRKRRFKKEESSITDSIDEEVCE